MITDMPTHPKIASGRCRVDVSWKSGYEPLSTHLCVGQLRSHFQIFFSRKCVHSWKTNLMSPSLSGFRGSSPLAASWPANQAEHDSFQGCFRLLWSKLDRKCFMEMEPRQLSKWVFFFLHSRLPLFLPSPSRVSA